LGGKASVATDVSMRGKWLRQCDGVEMIATPIGIRTLRRISPLGRSVQ
jgi:hypothetical protein